MRITKPFDHHLATLVGLGCSSSSSTENHRERGMYHGSYGENRSSHRWFWGRWRWDCRRELAAAGADVALSYVGRLEGATATVNAVHAAGRRSLAVQLDQRDPAAIDAAVESVIAEFGRVDILVNNAAWNIGIPFAALDAPGAEIWDRVLETNLRGPYLLARALAPHLRAHRAGRIVNIASLGGLYPGSSSIAYSASKAGLIHLTRCLAVALAPDVTVNCIAPGLVEGTRMMQRLPEEIIRGARSQAVLGRTAQHSGHRGAGGYILPRRSRSRDRCSSSTVACRAACTERSGRRPSRPLQAIGKPDLQCIVRHRITGRHVARIRPASVASAPQGAYVIAETGKCPVQRAAGIRPIGCAPPTRRRSRHLLAAAHG